MKQTLNLHPFNGRARRCAWFLAVFSLILPSAASSFPALQDNPERIARMHCQLWRYSMGDPRPLDFELLDEMAGEDGYTSNVSDGAIDSLWRSGGGLPDFGFLVGDRWRVATREDLKNVNRYAASFFRTHYRLAPPERFVEGTYRDSCRMRLSLSLLNPEANEPSGENDVIAYAETGLPTAGKGLTSLRYLLVKHPPEPWHVVDIEIGGESLAATYRQRWVTLVLENGFDGLIRTLAGEIISEGEATDALAK